MAMMGNPMDLEILSGLDDMSGDDLSGMDAFNALAGYDDLAGDDLAGVGGDDALIGALMGSMMGFNPISSIKKHPFAAAGIGAAGVGGALLLRKLMQRRNAQQARRKQLQASRFAQLQPLSALVSQVPGVTQRGTKVQPLGFTNGVFTATSGTTITVRARPQRPLRGGRLIGSFARSGVTATGLLTLVSLFVGTDGQLLSGDPISFDALAPNAFGVGVNLTPAAVGNEIVATVALSSAPTMTDTVTFNLTLFGMTIG